MAIVDAISKLQTVSDIVARTGCSKNQVSYMILKLRIDALERFGPVRVFGPEDAERIVDALRGEVRG